MTSEPTTPLAPRDRLKQLIEQGAADQPLPSPSRKVQSPPPRATPRQTEPALTPTASVQTPPISTYPTPSDPTPSQPPATTSPTTTSPEIQEKASSVPATLGVTRGTNRKRQLSLYLPRRVKDELLFHCQRLHVPRGALLLDALATHHQSLVDLYTPARDPGAFVATQRFRRRVDDGAPVLFYVDHTNADALAALAHELQMSASEVATRALEMFFGFSDEVLEDLPTLSERGPL